MAEKWFSYILQNSVKQKLDKNNAIRTFYWVMGKFKMTKNNEKTSLRTTLTGN